MVKSELLECSKELENKLCILCEDKLRKCRFQPCGHKPICELCFGKLLIEFRMGNVKCLLCQEVIEKWTEDDNNQTYFC